MTHFEKIINDIKTRVGEGIEPALKFLEQVLSPGSDNYNDFIQIKGRYNSLQRELLLGTLDPATYDQARGSISQALLLLADTLREDDLKPETAPPPAPAADKRGEVLYRIPDRMQLEHEEKCTVRLAWALEQLLRDWEQGAEDVIRDIRMAEIMGVYLLNVDERNPFAIRTITEPVQFVDKDDFTEWIFYVKPLLIGQFPLVLRVSVIEMINGRELKKDIVMEEQVLVVTEEVPPPDEAFKKAHESLVVAAAPAEGAQRAEEPDQSRPQQAAEAKRRRSRWLGIALSTVALAAVAVFFGVPLFQESRDWSAAQSGDRPTDYEDYLKKHPDGRHSAAAIDSLRRDTVASRLVETHEPSDTAAVETEPLPSPPVAPPTVTDPPERTRPQTRPRRQPPKRRPADNPPPPKPPETRPAPPPKPDPVEPPELTGRVASFEIKPFSIVKSGAAEFQFKFLKFNEKGQSVIILAGRGDWPMRAGQELTFVKAGAESVVTTVAYVARTDQGWLDGYFLLDRAGLQLLAKGKVTALRWRDRGDHQIKSYPLSGADQRELRDKAQRALKKLGN